MIPGLRTKIQKKEPENSQLQGKPDFSNTKIQKAKQKTIKNCCSTSKAKYLFIKFSKETENSKISFDILIYHNSYIGVQCMMKMSERT